MLAFQKAVFRY